MELTTGDLEVMSSGRRRLCMIGSTGMETNKSIKRRRRDPSAVALSCDDQQQQQSLGDRRSAMTAAATATATATTVKRSSRFRGVSRHRWTGRFEAHLWDKGTWNPTQRKKGKQVYLGAYDEEESAARAYDLAALKYWGTSTFTNFPVSDYEGEIEIMKTTTKEEYLASLRRRSSGFSRGVSKYRGVARHHHNGRWEARIGRVFGNKYLYLGTYSSQEEAARAYDRAAIEYRGINAVTNFDLSTYIRWLRPEADTAAPHESKSTIEPLPMTPSFSNHIRCEKPIELPILHTNPYLIDGLNLNTPKTEDSFHRHTLPISSCTKTSSPTALSLLLRSSIFKELVQKNLQATYEEDENDTKSLPQMGSNSGVRETLYDRFSSISHTCPSNGVPFPSLESGEERTDYTIERNTLWNRALNSPSSFR